MSEGVTQLTDGRIEGEVGGRRTGVCDLCGLPTRPAWTDGQDHQFCCIGCRQVFSILADPSGGLSGDFRQTDLYRTCLETGVIPSVGSGLPTPSMTGEHGNTEGSLELILGVKGMWCPACAWIIEEVLKRKDGVMTPKVSFFTDTVRLRYLPHLVSPVEIASMVGKLGYQAGSTEEGGIGRVVSSDLLKRLVVSVILTMNAMMLTFALYSGFFRELSRTTIAYLSYPLAAMTAPVVFWGGLPILRRAWAALKLRNVTMETLISISLLAAFFYSLTETARGGIRVYYDTAAMLVVILLLGRYIEMQARNRVVETLRSDETAMGKVRLVGAGKEKWASSEAVRPGDLFTVKAGERVPCDGCILHGSGLIDRAFVTGETTPVAKESRDTVLAGSLVVDGELTMAALGSAREGSFRQVAGLIESALEKKSSAEELADTISRYFVPAALVMTAVTAFILAAGGAPTEAILLRCLTVLLICCPCALGIATPLVKVAVVGSGRNKGVFVKNPEALERIKNVDVMVLDKTGTVTEGAFTLRRLVCRETVEEMALSMAAAVESGSSHLLAREIIRSAAIRGVTPGVTSQKAELKGMGVTGMVADKRVFVGNRRLLAACNARLTAELDRDGSLEEGKGMTVVFFGWDEETYGFFVFGDAVREGMTGLLQWLTDKRIEVFLLSGDNKGTSQAFARALGITGFRGEALPHDKVRFIEELQGRGHIVAMAGDGVNDAGALARADVGFAVGSAYNIMNDAADLMIPSGRPDKIIDAFHLAALSRRKVRQNLLFAFLYNAIAIPVAAMGYLNPLMAVLLMFLSSLTVTGNALHTARVGDSPLPERAHPGVS